MEAQKSIGSVVNPKDKPIVLRIQWRSRRTRRFEGDVTTEGFKSRQDALKFMEDLLLDPARSPWLHEIEMILLQSVKVYRFHAEGIMQIEGWL